MQFQMIFMAFSYDFAIWILLRGRLNITSVFLANSESSWLVIFYSF